MSKIATFSEVPPEIIYLILGHVLDPHDLLSFLLVFPHLAPHLSPAQTTAACDDGQTILHLLARQEGNPRSLATLLTNPTADPNIHAPRRKRSSLGWYPANSTEMGSEKLSWHGSTPLSVAAYHGNLAAVKLLLAHPATIADSPGDSKNTPLSLAAHRGHLPIVSLLLAHPDVDPNHPDNNDRTPLILAASQGRSAVVAALLTHPDIALNLRTPESRSSLPRSTPLSAAEIGRAHV